MSDNPNGSAKNDIIAFAFGKMFAIALLAISLLTLAKNTGVVSVNGFAEFLVSSYNLTVNFLLRPLDWIRFSWFSITDVEKSAVSLVLIILGGLSAWMQNKTIRWTFFVLGALITILIFGILVNQIEGKDLIVLALLVPFAPILLMLLVLRGIRYSLPFEIPIFGVLRNLFQISEYQWEFKGLVTVTLNDGNIDFQFRQNLITLNMILEYLATIAASLFIIFAIYVTGAVVPAATY